MKAKRRIGFGIGVGVCLVIIGIVYYRFNPAHYSFPKCPFLVLTGWKCAGCGSQRALHHLLHGNFYAAFKLNCLLVIALPYLLLGYTIEYTSWGKTKTALRQVFYGQRAMLTVLMVILSFWVLRNLV